MPLMRQKEQSFIHRNRNRCLTECAMLGDRELDLSAKCGYYILWALMTRRASPEWIFGELWERKQDMKKALFYGDSNTYGYDPAGFMGGRYPKESRWTALLAKSLKGEWEIAADGMPGRMIPRAGKGVEMLLDYVKAEMPLDLFAVMLGTNDLLSMRHPDALAVSAGMENLIRSAREALPSRILLVAPPQIRFTDPSCTEPFVRGDGTYPRDCLEQSTLLARFYGEMAVRYDILFADASAWELDFAFDGVHLSEEGNVLFAGEMRKVLSQVH